MFSWLQVHSSLEGKLPIVAFGANIHLSVNKATVPRVYTLDIFDQFARAT
jgi:hypothetical protein